MASSMVPTDDHGLSYTLFRTGPQFDTAGDIWTVSGGLRPGIGEGYAALSLLPNDEWESAGSRGQESPIYSADFFADAHLALERDQHQLRVAAALDIDSTKRIRSHGRSHPPQVSSSFSSPSSEGTPSPRRLWKNHAWVSEKATLGKFLTIIHTDVLDQATKTSQSLSSD